MERLKLLCLQYAAAIQRLITSSIDIPKTGIVSDGSLEIEKYKQLKLRSRSQTLKLAPENATVIESILYVKTIPYLQVSCFSFPSNSLTYV